MPIISDINYYNGRNAHANKPNRNRKRGRHVVPLDQMTGVNIAGGHAEYMVAYANATQLLP